MPISPLQFREFRNHAGSQIRLGQIRCAGSILLFFFGEIPVCADSIDKLAQTVCLVQHGSHAFLIVDAGQIFPVAFQRFLPVIFEEELCIVQTGPENSFVADLYIPDGPGSAVPHSEEVRHEGAVFILHRIVSLMISHGRNHCRYGQLQEFFINASVQGGRVFYQIIDFLQQICIVAYLSVKLLRNLQKTIPDQFPSFILVDNDIRLSHVFLIFFRTVDDHRFLAEETMAAAYISALYMSKFQRNHLIARQSHQPADRTDEMRFFIGPAHGAGKIEACNQRQEQFRQNFFHISSPVDHISPGIVAFPDQILRIDMLSSGKSLCRTGRISVLIKGSLNGRASLLHFFIGLAVCRTGDNYSQSSRSGIHIYFLKRNAVFFKFGSSESSQLIHYAGHDIGRHFLCSDFQKKIFTHFASLPFSMGNPSSFRFFSQALAHILDRLRTRAIYSVRSEREIAPAASSRLKEWEHFST